MPLSRRLAQLPRVIVGPLAASGSDALAVWLTHLLFADDLALMTEPTHEAARAALVVVADWGADFDLAINDGVGKTEAMHLAASVAEAATLTLTLPPLDVHVPGGKVLSV